MEGLEICCRSPCSIVENKHISSSPCENKSSRMARRRRMEIRRLKVIATSGVMAEEETASAAKRIKIADSKRCDVARDCFNAVDNSACQLRLSSQSLNCKNREEEEVRECVAVSSVNSGVVEENVTAVRAEPRESNCFDDFACPEHGMVTFCGRRREMEDAVSILPAFNYAKDNCTLHFYGVYDGHGGSRAALFCKDRLHEVLNEELKTRGDMQTESQWQKTMSSCFNRVDSEILSGGLQCKNDCKTSGSSECFCEQTIASETVGTTAVVAVVGSRQIIVANCGDSRAVLSRDGVAIPLSVDHKPDRPDEMSRIEKAGGRVIFWNGPRVFGVLAMSRAIGDKYLKPYVIAEPEVTLRERTDGDECLVLASDGLWDVLSNELVCEVARKCLSGRLRSRLDNGEESPSAAAAALLTKLALARGSVDNISVVVVDLRRHNNRR